MFISSAIYLPILLFCLLSTAGPHAGKLRDGAVGEVRDSAAAAASALVLSHPRQCKL